MRQLVNIIDRPRSLFGVLVPILIVSWFVSGVGGDQTASDGVLYWVGAVGWTVFAVTLLLTIIGAVFHGARLALHRTTT